MKTSQCQSLFGCTYPSFFMVLVDLWKDLTRIRLWGRMSDPYVKELFLTAVPQSSQKYPTLQTFLKLFPVIGRSMGSIWTSLQTSLSLSVPHWSVTTQLTYESVIHGVCLSASTVGRSALYLLSISHADGIHECLFVECIYNHFNWLGWQPRRCPFFHWSFYKLVWLRVSSSNSSLWPFQHFAFFCHILLWVFLVYCWSEGLYL